MHRLARLWISLAILGLIAAQAQVRGVDPAVVERVGLEERHPPKHQAPRLWL